MTPAAVCEGCPDNFKIKTEKEPASQKAMQRFIQRVADHAGLAAAQLTSLAPELSIQGHHTNIVYYEQTPRDGSFDNAIVVKDK